MSNQNDEFQNLIKDICLSNFAFLIGGGASISSNVKSPYELAYEWFGILYRYIVDIEFSNDEKTLWIKDFLSDENNWKKPNLNDYQIATTYKNRHNGNNWFQLMTFLMDGINNSYFQIATMIVDVLPNGREIINSSVERISDNARPQYGYMLLAYLLSKMKTAIGRHDAVITTNFDDMLVNAFYELRCIEPKLLNNSTKPRSITIGDSDEQLSRIAIWNKNPERPIIFHVHNSKEFNTRNTVRDVSYYPSKTIEALQTLLDNRCLLVMGYSGSDEGLMTVIKNTRVQRVYWLSYSGDKPRSVPFQRLENEKRGNLIMLTCPDPNEIEGCPEDCKKGFDSFMWKLVRHLYPECPLFPQCKSITPRGMPQDRLNDYPNDVSAQYIASVVTDAINNTEEEKPIINLLTYKDLGEK